MQLKKAGLTHAGYTFIELIMVVAIITILSGYMFMGSETLSEQEARQGELRMLYHGLQIARQSAVEKNSLVTLCPLDEKERCSNNWNQPIVIFTDPGDMRALGPHSQIIRQLPQPDRGTLSANAGLKRYFQFRPDGRVHGTLGHITYCPNRNGDSHTGRLIISMGGRVRFANTHSQNGVTRDNNGDIVRCAAQNT